MGSPDLFEALVRSLAELVHLTARRAGVQEADIPDIAQKVYAKLHEVRSRLDTSRSLAGWVRKTTYRMARDHLALAHHAHEVSSSHEEVEAEGTSLTPEEQMETIDVHAQVNAVLDTLRPELRLVLAMHDMEEMSMREVVEVLEIQLSTGYSRLEVARRAFEKSWNERRASEQLALAPFALWTARDLLATERSSVPRSPPGFEDEVWRRLVEALGVAGAGTAGAAAAGTVKAGVALTATQLTVGVILSALAGAGIAAALLASPVAATDAKTTPTAELAHRDARGAALPTPTASAPVALMSPPVAASSGLAPGGTSAEPKNAGTAPPVGEDEGLLLENASRALDRGDVQAALGLLARIRSHRFAAEREALRRRALAYQDGGR